MSFNPLVSIVIPVYNGANFMREAIDSALAQTYKNVEVIVVNDGSKDDGATDKIALSYGDRIRYIKKENGGVSTALNSGIMNMKGEYFSWLSHDDLYTADKVEKQVELLSHYQDPDLVALCVERQVDKNTEFLPYRASKRFVNGIVVSGEDVVVSLFEKGTFNGCALLIPKIAFDECGGFDEGLRYAQDAYMWLKIFLSGRKLIFKDDVGVYSRIHDNQLTQKGIELFHKDSETMSNYLIPKLLERHTKENSFLYVYALNNAKYNNRSVVKKCLAVAKEKKLFSIMQMINVRIRSAYGRVRPIIRRMYYRYVKKVKTN